MEKLIMNNVGRMVTHFGHVPTRAARFRTKCAQYNKMDLAHFSNMTRSDEAEAFFHAVYSAIQEIPYGKVTSYGHIAKLIGRPECPRQVGVCLKHLPSQADNPSAQFHNKNVPWQRVINSKGMISPRGYHASGALGQAAALRTEGVTVDTSAMGELIVDFEVYGWFPRVLPSYIAKGYASNDDDE